MVCVIVLFILKVYKYIGHYIEFDLEKHKCSLKKAAFFYLGRTVIATKSSIVPSLITS